MTINVSWVKQETSGTCCTEDVTCFVLCIKIILLTTVGEIDCTIKQIRFKMMMAWNMVVAVEVVESSCTPDINIWNIWNKE